MAEVPPGRSNALAAERRQQAWELRKAGATYRAIGGHIGVSHTQARRYVFAGIAELNAITQEDVALHRRLQLERLQDLLFACWPKARGGDLDAIAASLKILNREAALLGLDAVVQLKAELTGKDGGPLTLTILRNVHGARDMSLAVARPGPNAWDPHQRQRQVYEIIAGAAAGTRTLVGFGGAAGGGKTVTLAELAIDISLGCPAPGRSSDVTPSSTSLRPRSSPSTCLSTRRSSSSATTRTRSTAISAGRSGRVASSRASIFEASATPARASAPRSTAGSSSRKATRSPSATFSTSSPASAIGPKRNGA